MNRQSSIPIPHSPCSPTTHCPRSALVALVLTFASTLALAAALLAARPAWADPATGSISIAGVEDSVEITAYHTIEVNYDENTLAPDDPMFTWVPQIQTWVRQSFPSYIDDDGNVTEAFDIGISDSGELVDRRPASEASSFYGALASALSSGDVTLDAAGQHTGNGAIGGLPLGGYVVLIDNGMSVYRPSAVNIVPVWSEDENAWTAPEPASITVKASEVPIVKTVENKEAGAAAIGDTLTFDITAAVPVYPDSAQATTYAISDTLPAGLTLKQETLKVFGVSGQGETALEEGTHFNLDGDARPGATFYMNFDYENISSFESIHVNYEAELNGEATVGPDGNVNTAYVGYANDPYDESSYTKNPDSAKVITYGIEILKVGDGETPLSGAEFNISRSADGSDPLAFVKETSGVYHLASQGEDGSTTVVVAEDGSLKLEGLEIGEYYLIETKAPDGYLRLAAPLKATIADEDGDGAPDGASKTPGCAFLQVQNTHGFTLPVTGGMGTAIIVVAGLALAGSGAVAWVAARQRSKNENR